MALCPGRGWGPGALTNGPRSQEQGQSGQTLELRTQCPRPSPELKQTRPRLKPDSRPRTQAEEAWWAQVNYKESTRDTAGCLKTNRIWCGVMII